MQDQPNDLLTIPNLTSSDIEALLAAVIGGARRVERVLLSNRSVWIKHYGSEKPFWCTGPRHLAAVPADRQQCQKRRRDQDAAYHAWSQPASAAAIAELRRMTGFLGRFLSTARLIGRVCMGSDLRRFIVATSYLVTVPSNPCPTDTNDQRPQGRTP